MHGISYSRIYSSSSLIWTINNEMINNHDACKIAIVEREASKEKRMQESPFILLFINNPPEFLFISSLAFFSIHIQYSQLVVKMRSFWVIC